MQNDLCVPISCKMSRMTRVEFRIKVKVLDLAPSSLERRGNVFVF